jgi:hypothetical protein
MQVGRVILGAVVLGSVCLAGAAHAADVRVDLARDMSSVARSTFDDIDGRERIARAIGARLAGRSDLAACAAGVEVEVTDYSMRPVPWSATGRAARPHRVRGAGQLDAIRAKVTVRGESADLVTFDVEARAAAETTRRGDRLDRLARRLAREVESTVDRGSRSWC